MNEILKLAKFRKYSIQHIKIILYPFFAFLFFLFLLSNSNLFASDISDCLELEKLKAENEEITSKDAQEIATKICGIRARLGFTTENAKDFNTCMNNERIEDKDRDINYLELIENSIEICNDQLEAKKEIEAEIARQEAEEHKKKIRQKRIENQRIEEEKELERKQDKEKDKPVIEVYKDYYENGRLKEKGRFVNDKKHGIWKGYYPRSDYHKRKNNDNLQDLLDKAFLNFAKLGPGELKFVENYKKGMRHGDWIYYYEKKKMVKENMKKKEK